MNARRMLPALALLLMAPMSVLAAPASAHASTVVTDAATSARPAAGQDFPHLPRHCATRQEEIPQDPVICHLNTFHRNRPTIVLWGDSHAWMMIPALKAAVGGKPVNLVATVLGGCPARDPNLPPGKAGATCDQGNELALGYVRQLADGHQPLHVIIGGSWERYHHALKVHDTRSYEGQQAVLMQRQTPRLFRELGAAGIATTVLGQAPTVPVHRAACRRGNEPYSCDLPRRQSLPEASSTLSWLQGLLRGLGGGARPLDYSSAFCASTVCHGLIKGTHTWFDDLHLSATASRGLKPYLKPIVTDVLNQSAPDPEPSGPSGGCSLILFC